MTETEVIPRINCTRCPGRDTTLWSVDGELLCDACRILYAPTAADTQDMAVWSELARQCARRVLLARASGFDWFDQGEAP